MTDDRPLSRKDIDDILKAVSELRAEIGKLSARKEQMLFSARETARMIGMSYESFRKMRSRNSGNFPRARIRNGCLVWKRTDIEKWIDSLQYE